MQVEDSIMDVRKRKVTCNSMERYAARTHTGWHRMPSVLLCKKCMLFAERECYYELNFRGLATYTANYKRVFRHVQAQNWLHMQIMADI